MADSSSHVAVDGDLHGPLIIGENNLTVTATHSIVTVYNGPRPTPERRASIEMLPRRLGALIGRDVELAELDGAVRSAHIVQVHGPPGIGRSSLVRQAARQLAGLGDGVVFLDAAGRDVDDVMQDVFKCCYDASGYKPTPTELQGVVADAERLVALGLATVADRGYQLVPGGRGLLADHLHLGSGHIEQVATRLAQWVATPGRQPAQVADHGPFIAGVIAAATEAGRPELGARLARVTSPGAARSLRWAMWGQVLARGRDAARRSGDAETEAYLLHEEGVRSLLTGRRAAAAGALAAAAGPVEPAGTGRFHRVPTCPGARRGCGPAPAGPCRPPTT